MGKQNSCSKPPSSSKRSTGLRYPLVICYSLLSLLLNMAIEIVDLPSYNMVIFHSYVNVYQRVDFLSACPPSHRRALNARPGATAFTTDSLERP